MLVLLYKFFYVFLFITTNANLLYSNNKKERYTSVSLFQTVERPILPPLTRGRQEV